MGLVKAAAGTMGTGRFGKKNKGNAEQNTFHESPPQESTGRRVPETAVGDRKKRLTPSSGIRTCTKFDHKKHETNF